jgi:uncharacterized protein YccT (UPF0319 family)
LGYGPEYSFKFYSSVVRDHSTDVDLSKVQTKEVDFSLFNNKNEFSFTPHQMVKKLHLSY